jgi:hypothetical protein
MEFGLLSNEPPPIGIVQRKIDLPDILMSLLGYQGTAWFAGEL